MLKEVAAIIFVTMLSPMCYGKEGEPLTTNKVVQVINAGHDFKNLWQKAQGKPFEDQTRLWNENIESKYQNCSWRDSFF